MLLFCGVVHHTNLSLPNTQRTCVFFYHREILEEIAEYERQMSRESMKSSLTQRIQLEPIQGGGRDKLLQQVSGHA